MRQTHLAWLILARSCIRNNLLYDISRDQLIKVTYLPDYPSFGLYASNSQDRDQLLELKSMITKWQTHNWVLKHIDEYVAEINQSELVNDYLLVDIQPNKGQSIRVEVVDTSKYVYVDIKYHFVCTNNIHGRQITIYLDNRDDEQAVQLWSGQQISETESQIQNNSLKSIMSTPHLTEQQWIDVLRIAYRHVLAWNPTLNKLVPANSSTFIAGCIDGYENEQSTKYLAQILAAFYVKHPLLARVDELVRHARYTLIYQRIKGVYVYLDKLTSVSGKQVHTSYAFVSRIYKFVCDNASTGLEVERLIADDRYRLIMLLNVKISDVYFDDSIVNLLRSCVRSGLIWNSSTNEIVKAFDPDVSRGISQSDKYYSLINRYYTDHPRKLLLDRQISRIRHDDSCMTLISDKSLTVDVSQVAIYRDEVHNFRCVSAKYGAKLTEYFNFNNTKLHLRFIVINEHQIQLNSSAKVVYQSLNNSTVT